MAAISYPRALGNLNRLAQTNQQKMPHDDTVAYLCKHMPTEGLRRVRTRMVHRMLQSRMLEKYRLLDHLYLIAIDGTGFLSLHERHCERCLTKELSNGQTIYQHPVLEAKLITPTGLALSVASEFLENTNPNGPQDCELKAFYRLVPRLRETFPRLPICLLLDAEFLNQQIMQMCENKRLEWIATFREGSLPEAYDEFQRLTELAPENRLIETDGDITRRYRWMHPMQHEGHTFSAFECCEKKGGGRGAHPFPVGHEPQGPPTQRSPSLRERRQAPMED
jgi:hypothetical protein